jgi:hypothetical protein
MGERAIVGCRNHGDLPALLVKPIPVHLLVQDMAVRLDRLLFRHPTAIIVGQVILHRIGFLCGE